MDHLTLDVVGSPQSSWKGPRKSRKQVLSVASPPLQVPVIRVTGH